MDKAMILIINAIEQARSGVEFDEKDGALCPYCNIKLKIQRTRPWNGKNRKRYHYCDNPKCALAIIGQSIKSWQRYEKKHNGNKKIL